MADGQHTATTAPAASLGSVEAALVDFVAGMSPIRFSPGDVILSQGHVSDCAYFIANGSVQVYSETAYGAVPLATLPAPRLIGEIGVLADLARTASVKAASVVEAYALSKEQLLELGQRAPTLLLSIIAQLGRQIDAVNKTIGLYTNALGALERRESDAGILADLAKPPPELADFATVFKRFADQIVLKRRQQDELAAAAMIQQSLLPQAWSLPAEDGRFSLHARMRPARDIGGDFYDYFMLDDDHVAVSIGDVCGKGVPASLFMAIVVTVLRASARERGSVKSMLAWANALLSRDNPSSQFATTFFGVLNLRTGEFQYCNCGHNAPLLVSRSEIMVKLPATGLPLGLYENRMPDVMTTLMRPGDIAVLFTDGVTEATNIHGEEFGDQRLHQAIFNNLSAAPEVLIARLFAAVDDFAHGAEQADDITCIALSLAPR